MWGRSIFSQELSFVRLYTVGRNSYNLTPALAAQFAIRIFEQEDIPEAISPGWTRDLAKGEDRPGVSDGMKKEDDFDFPPVPPRGSRKSVNWAPQFSRPEKEEKPPRREKPCVTRSSSGLIPRNPSESTVKTEQAPMEKISKEKVGKFLDGGVPIRIVSYRSSKDNKRKKKKQKQATRGAARVKESNRDRKSPLESKPKSYYKLRNCLGPGADVGEDSGGRKEGKGDVDQDMMAKTRRKFWVSVPLNDMESVEEETHKQCLHDCAGGNQSCEIVSGNETVKIEDDHKVAISTISEVCASLLKSSNADMDETTLEGLQVMVTGVKRVMADVENMVQSLHNKKVPRTRSETGAEEQKLREEIATLRRNNQAVLAERDRLKTTRERDTMKLEDEKKRALAALNSMSSELQKEQEKSSCQICFTRLRDAIVLPCMHFHYCNDCLQKHQQLNTECPTCRGKISGVLRCNISTS